MEIIERETIIREEMIKYISELERIEGDIIERLEVAPKGYLNIKGTDKRRYYYWFNSYTREDNKPVYLKKDNSKLIQALVQKSYDRELLKRVINDKNAVKQCLDMMKGNLDSVFTTLSEIRKKYVRPYRLDDKAFIENWLQIKNIGNPNHPEGLKHTTLKKELVRSKSEKSIANTLFRLDIPYKYEMPLHLRGFGIVHPDFTILDVKFRREIYWEHFGMMDDPEYTKKITEKITHYANNGIILGKNLIITMETNDCPLDQPMIDQLIETFFM